MPSAHIVREIAITRTARVMQLEGLFDIAPSARSERSWDATLPLDERQWNIGLIVGPSGCGKSTLAIEMFGADLIRGFDWPAERSIVDAFPAEMSIKDVTGILSSVGFSSPPAWLRPFRALSNGEQFRVTLARAIAQSSELFVLDEFTSVVDRTVAQIGSAAVAKTIRRRNQRMIAVGVHYDVIDWLQPDWIYEPHVNRFQWRELQPRPAIALDVRRVHRSAWQIFKHHHYLDTSLVQSAGCFVAFVNKQPAAFTSVISFPHATAPGWREHRSVCLPDFQGVGIGNALSEYVMALYRSSGKPIRSVTSSPSMILHRAKSQLWRMFKSPSLNTAQSKRRSTVGNMKCASNRYTASFEFIGPAKPEEAAAFGLSTGRKV